MTYRIPLHSPTLPEKANTYIQQALAGQQSADGPFGRACEDWLQQQTGRTILLTASCTAALEMAAILAGIKAGDEIILPSFTFPSSANAFVRLGAVPVFVDIRPDTLNLDEALVEAAITPRTRALVAVHYAGVACQMDTLQAICQQHGLLLIEDAAQALMASYQNRPLGSFGNFAAFSFHSTKNIGCGEGGALLINDKSLQEKAWQLRDKGTNRMAFLRGDVAHYQWTGEGSSYGLSDINAALLLAQLEEADTLTQQRLARWQIYHQALEKAEEQGLLTRPTIPQNCQHNAHIYQVLLADRATRDQVQQHMQQAGINACSHYEPLHSSPAGKRLGKTPSPLPVTEQQAGRLLRLPLWSSITQEQQQEVIDRLLSCLSPHQH